MPRAAGRVGGELGDEWKEKQLDTGVSYSKGGGVVIDVTSSKSLYETSAVPLFTRLPTPTLLAARGIATWFAFFPTDHARTFEEKRDCSQSLVPTLLRVYQFAITSDSILDVVSSSNSTECSTIYRVILQVCNFRGWEYYNLDHCVFNNTIIMLELVGYEMTIAISYTILVQSLNSPFFPPHMGAKPGRAKEESRITCMRMLRTNQSKITRSQPRRSRQCVAQCLFQLALWKKTFSLTILP